VEGKIKDKLMREEKSLRKGHHAIAYFREDVCSLALTSSFELQTLNTYPECSRL